MLCCKDDVWVVYGILLYWFFFFMFDVFIVLNWNLICGC